MLESSAASEQKKDLKKKRVLSRC